MKESKNRYESINGLKVIACVGIVLMHIKANTNYMLDARILATIIDEFTNFVFLFMIISSFGLCCGYYEKFTKNEIDIGKFYQKRIKKILPFFTFLTLIDVIVNHNMKSIIEAFANLTLMFGFISKELTVIGVGWFIGLIFIFYLIFPFFTYLFANKRRAWLVTLIAVVMNISSIYYFNIGRTNMFYSFIYFCLGGLIYLYKDRIISIFKKSRIVSLLVIIIAIICYFVIPSANKYLLLLRTSFLSLTLLSYAISYNSKILTNKVINYISNNSLEIYLCHMMIFRILEKIGITKLFTNSWFSYIIVCILVLTGSLAMSIMFKYIYTLITHKEKKNENTTS